MEKKIALSIDEMKHLESLGLDTSDASMCWWKHNNWTELKAYSKQDLCEAYEKAEWEHLLIPAYTLQDILEKLPNKIYGKDLTSDIYKDMGWVLQKSMSTEDKYKIVYCQDSIEEDYVQLSPTIEGYSLLGTAYQMLIWCIENNYIKINK